MYLCYIVHTQYKPYMKHMNNAFIPSFVVNNIYWISLHLLQCLLSLMILKESSNFCGFLCSFSFWHFYYNIYILSFVSDKKLYYVLCTLSSQCHYLHFIIHYNTSIHDHESRKYGFKYNCEFHFAMDRVIENGNGWNNERRKIKKD